MIYKSKYTGAQIDGAVDNARTALAYAEQDGERIQLLEATTENLSTQIGNQSVRIDNVSNTANTAKSTADSALSKAQEAITATDQNASRIQIIEDTAPTFSLSGTTLTITKS